jgi:hypothetical protein
MQRCRPSRCRISRRSQGADSVVLNGVA